MMKEIKLSIIIPCYNSEDTITETINCFSKELSPISLNNPSFKYEIIVVNDGSTDNSTDKIEKIVTDNISLLSKENSGVSETRNFGLNYAKGEYIWFFDSDDLLFENVGHKIYEILSLSPDIIKVSSVTVDRKTKNNIESFNNTNNGSLIYKGKYNDYLTNNKTSFSCWSMIVKRKLLTENNITFNSKLSIGEDVLWNITIANTCGEAEIIVTNLNVVKYIVNSNSIVNTINPIANYRYYKNSLELYENLQSFQLKDKYLAKTLEHFKSTTINQIITKFLSCKISKKEIKKELSRINKIIDNEKINTPQSKVFKILSNNTLMMYLSQLLYRNIFLKYIKPHIGRN